MKSIVTFLLFSLFFCGQLLGANLSWDRTEVDIELGPDQEEVRASFVVTNDGAAPVRIANVRTSCGCTGSIVDRKIIEPGESTEIVGTFNKGKRRGMNRNRLQVFIDSEPDAVATLLMNIKIPELIKVSPPVVYWSQESSHSPREAQIQLDERYLNKITNIRFDESKLDVVQKDGQSAGSSLSTTLVITPKDYLSPYRGSVIIEAKGPNGRTAETKVHAFIQP